MTKMTRNAAARIQSSTCRNYGSTPKGSFAARAMSAAYRNEPSSTANNREGSLLSKVGLFAVAAGVAAVGYYLYNSLQLGGDK